MIPFLGRRERDLDMLHSSFDKLSAGLGLSFSHSPSSDSHLSCFCVSLNFHVDTTHYLPSIRTQKSGEPTVNMDIGWDSGH